MICFILALTGCPAIKHKEPPHEIKEDQWERPVAKAMIPINLAAAYFGAIGTHEGGHALASSIIGARSIKVDVLPTRYDDGILHLGLTRTTYKSAPSRSDDFWANVAGPSAVFSGQIFAREALKTGYVPLVLQPPMQWYSVGCKIQFYGEILLGACRRKTSDFGKEPIWATLAFGGAGLLYDIWDIGFCDDPERYFKCLVGDAFYTTEREQRRWFAYFGSRNGGGELAFVWRF